MPKSRYASVSLYISEYWMNRPAYNDIEAPHDPAIFDRLRQHGELPRGMSGSHRSLD